MRISSKDPNYEDYVFGRHRIVVPAKDCNEPLKTESSSDINQEYRQLLGVYSYLQFYSSSSPVKISTETQRVVKCIKLMYADVIEYKIS